MEEKLLESKSGRLGTIQKKEIKDPVRLKVPSLFLSPQYNFFGMKPKQQKREKLP